MTTLNKVGIPRHKNLRAEIRPEPDLFDHAREREQQESPAVRWIMRHSRVSASIAQIVALNSGIGGLHHG